MTKRSGISPVIATVIIVAVTIAVAIAVAFWMTGIVGLFTSVEKLEIVTAYAQQGDQINNNQNFRGWTVFLTPRNTGTTPTSIDTILINGIPSAQCTNVNANATPISVNPGDVKTLRININNNAECGTTKFVGGSSIEVKLHTTGGKEYPKLLVLP
ncbi:MAG: archaellin/type IV pilin N-terminal domain-containing protein [Infirmifilum sp.]